MKPRTFLKKFPNAPQNENCLIDIACPKCGHRDEFSIEVSSFARVSDNGTNDIDTSDTEWTDKSYCRCCNCNHVATVAAFTIEGLDEALAEGQRKAAKL